MQLYEESKVSVKTRNGISFEKFSDEELKSFTHDLLRKSIWLIKNIQSPGMSCKKTMSLIHLVADSIHNFPDKLKHFDRVTAIIELEKFVADMERIKKDYSECHSIELVLIIKSIEDIKQKESSI